MKVFITMSDMYEFISFSLTRKEAENDKYDDSCIVEEHELKISQDDLNDIL